MRQPSAGAAANFGDCPDVVIAPVGTVCRESFVIFARETRVVGGGSNAPSQAPWGIYARTYTLTFPAPEGAEPLESDVIEGTLDNPVASSDDQRVSFATVAAVVPMSDGSTFDFQGTWLGWSERWVYGSNGPLNIGEGIPRHFVDRCTTHNANAHQTGRFARMNGTLNGQPVHSYTSFDEAGAIFYNHFVYVDVTHGGCP